MREAENLHATMINFNMICEAYEVLSDQALKLIYDKNGHKGLKNIDGKKDGRCQSCYVYQGNCFEIFEKFFGNRSPWTDNFDHQHKYSTSNAADDEHAPKDIIITL